MLRDLTKQDWLELLKLPRGRIPSALILRGGRSLRSNYIKHRSYFQNVIDIETSNGSFDDLFVGDLNGRSVAYASVYGAPMASEIVHIFGVLGIPMVIQTATAGLSPTKSRLATCSFQEKRTEVREHHSTTSLARKS